MRSNNKFLPSLFLDYSCMDNIKKLYLEDTPHHVFESLSLVASNIYNLYPFDIKTSGSLLHGLAKQNSTKIMSFKHMLKFKRVLLHLIYFLCGKEVWSISCDKAYEAFMKCQVEMVINLLIFK